jgi:hypothetical protein
MKSLFPIFLLVVFGYSCTNPPAYEISGERRQYHKITLTFDGPELSEMAEDNPFTDYRLLVQFQQGDMVYEVPGYFAADGNAGETSAQSGNKWRVHFNPEKPGEWDFTVFFRKGENIAITDEEEAGEPLDLDGVKGTFSVAETDKTGRDFRAKGRISVSENGRFFQHASGEYFLKGGADSPENFLAYYGFDDTYRHAAEAREGEADPTENLHRFAPHLGDWQEGDPTWQDGKGKELIGALNFLAGQGMNSVYFLVMNIGGDGKDVWPYVDHETFDRFDCSKLDQWELVFQHMEKLGLMMHVVTQETENERLLDGGDTGPQRKLFYRELIARFGHHNALVWNLGEENGPADFSPDGQNAEQQKAMATGLKSMDPYGHPVVIHTHSWKGQKDLLLPDLLGHQPLDGLSFQVDRRAQVHEEVLKWSKLAEESAHPWLIAMDEIGMWYMGVKPDAVDPGHDSIRQEVLWGSLMAGAAGVEWYFGANYEHNDLACEDWRSRENMWEQTRYALEFFTEHLAYWEMQNRDELLDMSGAYCLAKEEDYYVLFFPKGAAKQRYLSLKNGDKAYSVQWYNPRTGGALAAGTVAEIKGVGRQEIGLPPKEIKQDWVALVKRQ